MFLCAENGPSVDAAVPRDSEVTQLAQRLEEWMSSVDDRLDSLLDAFQIPVHPGGQLRESTLTTAYKESARDTLPSLAPSEVCHVNTLCSNDVTRGLSGHMENSSRGMSGPIPTQDPNLRKQASRRLLTQAFYRKCNSFQNQEQGWSRKSFMERLVKSRQFDYGIAVLLVVNAVLIGAEVEWRAQGQEDHVAFLVMEWVCAGIFAAELALRLTFAGRSYCGPDHRWWAMWDVVLVGISAMDLVLRMVGEGSDDSFSLANIGSTGRLLKIARMLRILRLLRMVRFLSELRVMANMIQKSMKSLFWLFSLLALLIYVFSVVLTQGTTDHLLSIQQLGPRGRVLQGRYGSLFVTMYTLFQAMCGGVSWGEVTTPLQDVGAFYFVTALLYIFFSIFSVFNIVTGVFVDGAIELAKQDRSMLTAKKHISREASAIALVELLKDMDEDGNNILTLSELKHSLLRTDVQEYLDALCVDTTQAEMIFTLLDEDGNGDVDIEEFVSGMQRLQGEAKNFDIHVLMHDNRRVLEQCSTVFEWISSSNQRMLDHGLPKERSTIC